MSATNEIGLKLQRSDRAFVFKLALISRVKSLRLVTGLLRVKPTEEQYLVLNALETLDLLYFKLYDQKEAIWILITPSPVLPRSYLLQNGEIVSFEEISEL